jgi:hypothetical protein
MAKKLSRISVTKPKLLAHHYVDIAVQLSSNVLIMAFLICIVVYIPDINTYTVTNEKNSSQNVHQIKPTMQNFIHVMAWIMIVVIGLSAFISLV